MKQMVDEEIIDRIGRLAKLELSEQEKDQARRDVARMLAYVGCLNELDTVGVEPLYQVTDGGNVFREDVVTESDRREEMLGNAPDRREDLFAVPRTFS